MSGIKGKKCVYLPQLPGWLSAGTIQTGQMQTTPRKRSSPQSRHVWHPQLPVGSCVWLFEHFPSDMPGPTAPLSLVIATSRGSEQTYRKEDPAQRKKGQQDRFAMRYNRLHWLYGQGGGPAVVGKSLGPGYGKFVSFPLIWNEISWRSPLVTGSYQHCRQGRCFIRTRR